MTRMWRPCACVVAVAAVVLWGTRDATAQEGAARGEWGVFGGDAGATRFASLDQIHAGNVAELEVAWRWSARNYGSPPPSARMQVSPLMIDGVLYTTVGNQRDVVAVDAATGETIWTWRPGEGERRWGDIIEPLTRTAGRGVSYWTDGAGDERIFVVTPTYQLVALDARTGYQIEGFGEGGVVDMIEDLRWDERPGTYREGRVSNTSPPAILGDVVVPSDLDAHGQHSDAGLAQRGVAHEHPRGRGGLRCSNRSPTVAVQHGSKRR